MSVADRTPRSWNPFARARNPRPSDTASVPHKLLATPQDIVEADGSRARAIYEGAFTFGRITHVLPPEGRFETDAARGGDGSVRSKDWAAHLHGFQWLRDLNASSAPTARLNGAALVIDWIDACGMPSSMAPAAVAAAGKALAWNADVAATRLMAWLRHGEALFVPVQTGAAAVDATGENAVGDVRPQRWFRSLVRHVRYLNGASLEASTGETRLRVRIALAMAAICIDGRARNVERAVKGLEQELARQIAPDGGHMSRNPSAQARILCDLLPLLRLFTDKGEPAPDILASRTARMVEALRFFRHSHGRLAQFNGTGTVDDDLVGRLLRVYGVEGRPVASLVQTGFDRLSSGRTVVLVDTGTVARSVATPDAMAGALSFEMSSGGRRFIMNCGWPDVAYAAYREVARATAAHSTLTVDDTSSIRHGENAPKGLFDRPSRKNPASDHTLTVIRQRSDDATHKVLTARHDGYAARFGLCHERHVEMPEGGNILQGIDRLIPTGDGPAAGEGLGAAIRFHIPPDISVSHLASGHSVLLAIGAGKGGNDAWTFTCIDAPVRLEESIRFDGVEAGDSPRKAMQIVLAFDVPSGASSGETREIRWTLQRNVQPSRKQMAANAQRSGQVGDLLAVLDEASSTDPSLDDPGSNDGEP